MWQWGSGGPVATPLSLGLIVRKIQLVLGHFFVV
jgi:hypothetical protein